MFGFERLGNRRHSNEAIRLFPYRKNVRYNVSNKDQKKIAQALWGVDDHQFEYESNRPRPRRISATETKRVYLVIYRSFEEFATRHSDIPEDKKIEFELSGMIMGLALRLDRSVEIPCEDIKWFGIDFVEHVQRTILTEWPDWRLMILGDMLEGELPMLVYPTGVCIGDEAFEKSEQGKGIQAWQETIYNAQEERERPRREQESIVLSKTADAVQKIDEEGVILIASFDNEEGDYDRYAHWFLFKKSNYLFREITSDEHYHSDQFNIGLNGQKTDLDNSNSHSLAVVSVAKDFAAPASDYELVFVPDNESSKIRFSFDKTDFD